MKRLARSGLVALWQIFATLAVAYWWGRHPTAIPPPPVEFSLWLDDLFDARCCEASARVDVYYMLTCSFVATALGTFIGLRIWKRARTLRDRRPPPSG
ncbi:hypothetical protein Bsp3421_004975 [Burkholderia sp. FERM BP-3421]|uniref:hypothetical protein n=1 Tax=Burkholderia sp. FERM BP-3421 TaxID=1494466 RepID=UPI00235F41CC|nr:hypothetical protein [Burkholderia sp. FERM BP-3421]WDD94830.1 hypothetical protein Bsp3421_004975 [Burkholderia sp. FERM BP-3421]